MRVVRKIVFLLGLCSLTILAANVLGALYLGHRGQTLDQESRAYTANAVTAVVAHWNANELLRRAAPQLLRASKPNAVRAFVAAAADRFGPMVRYEGSRGQARILTDFGRSTVITAHYVALVRCAKGEVELRIGLIKRDGRWMITGFHMQVPKGTNPFSLRSA